MAHRFPFAIEISIVESEHSFLSDGCQTRGPGVILNPGVDLGTMPKKILLEKHLEKEELERPYRKARDLVLRSHYQIVWLG